MKRVGYIYPKICDIDNILLAMQKASNGKRSHKNVKRILDNNLHYAIEIQKMLVNKTYVPSPYTEQEITDRSSNKTRVLKKPQFYPDQIIHWALLLQTEHIINRGMYKYTCSNVKGRGTIYAMKAVKKWVQNDTKNTKYCLVIDVKKYFHNIKNSILKIKLRKVIKDEDCLWLFDVIINTSEGLPLGNCTSPLLANFYLQDTDHYLKEKLKVKYMIRYMDDICIFGPNKKALHKIRKEIECKFKEIGLELKSNWQVFNTRKRNVDFVGFCISKDCVTIRKRISLRILRKCRKIAKGRYSYANCVAFMSYWGWLQHADAAGIQRKYIKDKINIKQTRRVIGNENRNKNRNKNNKQYSTK